MRDDERVARTMTDEFKLGGYNIPYEVVLGVLRQGLANGPEHVYQGQTYKEGYVLYIP